MNADDGKSRPHPDPIFSLDDWKAYLRWESSEEFSDVAERAVLPPGSALRKTVRAGNVPEEVERVLWAIHVVQKLQILPQAKGFRHDGRVSEAYRQLLAGIRSVIKVFTEERPHTDLLIRPTVENGILTTTSNRGEIEAFIKQIEVLENRARRAERTIEAAGLRLDPDSGTIQIPPGPKGGHPRRLLRALVEALLRLRGRERNDSELREWLVEELAPLFSPEILDTSSDGILKHTVDNVYREFNE